VPRIPIAALRFLLAALLFALPACSRRAERLVGNDVLARGAQGLGVIQRDTTFADRDTHVPGLGRDTGASLLAGQTATMQAATYFRVSSWALPADTTAASSFSVLSFSLHAPSRGLYIPRDARPSSPSTIMVLATAASPWDSTTVTWPGPGPSATGRLGQATENFDGGDLIVPLTLSMDTLRTWAAKPDSAPGFTIYSPLQDGIAAYVAGSIQFRMIYEHTVLGVARSDTLNTGVSQDLYVYTPTGTTPAGTESTLTLGGFEEKSVLIHAPNPVFPEAASINQAVLLLRVDPSTDTAAFASQDSTVDIEVRTIGADWAESGASLPALMASTAPVAVYRGFTYHGTADSLISIHLPGSTLRAWAQNPAGNYGLLLTAAGGNLVSPIYIRSRESGDGAELLVGDTTPPRGRF
jgi:hypothetical protein